MEFILECFCQRGVKHAISFFKALLEILSLKFIPFIIIQNDRYSKPVGREVNLEQMIA